MKWCFDKRILAGLAMVALAGVVFAPRYATTFLPILALLACPASMLVMMRRTSRPTPLADQPADQPAQDAEVVRLQAELDALKAQLRDRRR